MAVTCAPSAPCPRRAAATATSPSPARRPARPCSPRLARRLRWLPTASRRRQRRGCASPRRPVCLKGRILRSRRLPSASMLLFQLAPGPPRCRRILLPPSRCRRILLPPSRCRRIPRSLALPPMLPRGMLLTTLRAQPLKRPILSSPIFYNEAGDIVNYNPNVQVASRACMHLAGPVQVNFPFDAPLKPDFPGADLQAMQRAARDCFASGRAQRQYRAAKDGAPSRAWARLLALPARCRRPASRPSSACCGSGPCLVLAGEGSCETVAEAEEILAWARKLSLPVLADPLSGLRAIDDALVIDNYDNLCGGADCPAPEVVIRFGRYPISKSATALLERTRPVSPWSVDVAETRDFNAATDVFVGTTPLGFVRSGLARRGPQGPAPLRRCLGRPQRRGAPARSRRGMGRRGGARFRGHGRRLRAIAAGTGAGGVVPLLGELDEHPCRGHLLREGRQAPGRDGQPWAERHRRRGLHGGGGGATFRPDDVPHGRLHAAARSLRSWRFSARCCSSAVGRKERRRWSSCC